MEIVNFVQDVQYIFSVILNCMGTVIVTMLYVCYSKGILLIWRVKIKNLIKLYPTGTNLKSVDKYGRTPLSVAKSRLRFLMEEKDYSSERVKDETLEVSYLIMLVFYL